MIASWIESFIQSHVRLEIQYALCVNEKDETFFFLHPIFNMSTDATSEPLLFSSSDYDNEELARLVELQRRQTELLQPDIDHLDFEDDEDDFSVTNRAAKKGPTVPDMRFEKQVEKSIAQLQEKGASNFSIAWSIVVKDNILIPFVSGFTWSVCSTAWSWYRARGVVNARNPAKKFGFFRGIQHGIAEWTK